MPTKEEILNFVKEKLDKAKYQDYLLNYKESKNKFMIEGREMGAEELVDGS